MESRTEPKQESKADSKTESKPETKMEKKEKNKNLRYTQNRELSWLRFNSRVLEEAGDESVPLLERLKFVSIFTSNLDEFFMIRVGSLYDMVAADKTKKDNKSGMTPQEQLQAIYEAVAPMYKERDKIYTDIKKQLAAYGICGLDMKELEQPEKKFVKKYFKEQILPVLSPQIVDTNHPFPHLLNKQIYVIASLKLDNRTMMGIVPIPSYIPDVLYLPGKDVRYIRMEKIVMEYLELIFGHYHVLSRNYICVTRNADISPDDEAYADNEDFRFIMKETLHKRRRMAVVRLEAASALSKEAEKVLCEKLKIRTECIFKTKNPMRMEFVYDLMDKVPASMKRSLTDEPFSPQPSASVHEGGVMAQVKKRDILLSYPYESMEPFLQLVKEAGADPDVMTIKITIYRLARKTRLVEYLCAAAENGKEVTVLIELRARFDEQNNIDWSERLEEAGCRVIYGFEGYKVHSKICLITYRNKNDIQYITQIGTGNYNETTAKLYTDYSLMTSNRAIGEDAAAFFKNMSIGNLNGAYQHLIVSPFGLKKKILMLMDEEIEKGAEGRIIMKMNSVTDIDFIRKVSEASQEGVKVDLIVRGICCILPGIPEATENLTVTSIVGRFLEHQRVFMFGEGESRKIYIGSADMMTRNTEKRVEVACPVYDPQIKTYLVHCIDIMLKDNVKARVMQSDGTYVKKPSAKTGICAQETFMKEAIQAKRVKEEEPKKSFFEQVKGFFRRKRK